MMEKHYNNMYTLLDQEQEAWAYFHSLPQDIRDRISERESHIRTYTRLRIYGDSLSKRG